jgi:hypothetical protein
MLLKVMPNLLNYWCIYFVWLLEYVLKKFSLPTKRATVILIKVKSCNALLRMLLACILRYLKHVLRYKFLILVTCHPDTLYSREQGCENMWLFFDAKRVLWPKNSLGNTPLYLSMCWCLIQWQSVNSFPLYTHWYVVLNSVRNVPSIMS